MSTDPNRLRLEALRMRAAIEREELAGAVDTLRQRTLNLRRLAAAANRLGSAVAGGSGPARSWLPLAAAALEQRPWVGLLVAGAIRLARRKPWVAVAAVAALLVVARVRRTAQEGEQSAAVERK
jgi:hypothetical protein